MKEKLKRFLASLAAVIMAVGMMAGVSGVPVRAASNNTITVQNAQPGQTYTLYRLFNATTTSARASGGPEGIAYNYTLTGTNKTLETQYTFTGTDEQQHTVKGSDWFEIDSAGNVKAKADTTNQSLTTENFQYWAKQFGTKVGDSKKYGGTEAGTLTFSNLTDGYYFLTSTMGSLVTVTSIAPNQNVKDKNSAPTVVKNEDVKTSDVGATVTYTVEISLPNGSSNVVFHDRIDNRLTLVDQKSTVDGTTTNNYTLTSGSATGTALKENIDYTVERWSNTDATATDVSANLKVAVDDNITISFSSTYLSSLTTQTTVYLKYTATLSDEASINMANTALVTYGDNNTESTPSTVDESTFGFQVNKLDGTTDSPTALNGAKFALSKNGNLGNLKEGDNNTIVNTSGTDVSNSLLAFKNNVYDSNNSTGSSKLVTANNSVVFRGLNNDEGTPVQTITYYLYEVTAPDGYNKLTEPVQIQIVPTFSDTNTNQATQVTGYTVQYKNSASDTNWSNAVDSSGKAISVTDLTTVRNINILNVKGKELPSTGGIGTTIFYVIGGVLIASAVVLLVVRRRRNA